MVAEISAISCPILICFDKYALDYTMSRARFFTTSAFCDTDVDIFRNGAAPSLFHPTSQRSCKHISQRKQARFTLYADILAIGKYLLHNERENIKLSTVFKIGVRFSSKNRSIRVRNKNK